MRVRVERKGQSLLIAVEGEMDAPSSKEFEAAYAADGKDSKDVVLDMAGVVFISSAGLRAILAAAKDLEARGGALRLCGLGGMVKDVFKVSGLLSMFTVADTAEEFLGE